jgi:hypothetical protein
MDDPGEMLSAVELGRRLGISDETVRQRETAGELFSIVRPGRKRGREYPAYQAWRGVTGEPLKRILEVLGDGDGATAFMFFAVPNELLGGLMPVELMTGRVHFKRQVEQSALGRLSAPCEARLKSVARAAAVHADHMRAP